MSSLSLLQPSFIVVLPLDFHLRRKMSGLTVPKMSLISQKIRAANSQRSFKSTLSVLQRQSRHDPGVEGSAWVTKVSLPAPKETDIREALFDAIKTLSDDSLPIPKRPDISPVEVEWIGARQSDDSTNPLSEKARYEAMMRDVQTPTTILYARGGAF